MMVLRALFALLSVALVLLAIGCFVLRFSKKVSSPIEETWSPEIVGLLGPLYIEPVPVHSLRKVDVTLFGDATVLWDNNRTSVEDLVKHLRGLENGRVFVRYAIDYGSVNSFEMAEAVLRVRSQIVSACWDKTFLNVVYKDLAWESTDLTIPEMWPRVLDK